MDENKISARQLRRMIFIETFGAGALSVPALACYRGQNGFGSLIFYGIFLTGTVAFFVIFSGKIISGENLKDRKTSENNSRNRKTKKKIWENKRMSKKSLSTENRNLNEKTSLRLKKESLDTKLLISNEKKNLKFMNFLDLLPQPIKIVYIIRFFINAVALFYFFGQTIQTVYMPESSFLFILLPAAILLWYSLYTTLQKRARFLELIFPWIITTFIIAVILSFIGIEKAMQIGNTRELWQGILSDNIFQSMENGYLLLLCSSPIEFLLFLRPVTEERGLKTKVGKVEKKEIEKETEKRAGKAEKKELEKGTEKAKGKNNKIIWSIITASLGAFFCNAIFCFLAVRTLGPTLTSQSEWPVIKMMQLIRMPGGFLERFDILPVVFWILCMMAVLSGYLYYSWSLCRDDSKQKSKHFLFTGILIICLVLFSYLVEKNNFLWTFYLKYKAIVDFPLSLALPIIIYMFKKKKEDFDNSERNSEDNEKRNDIMKYKEAEMPEENSIAKYGETEISEENSVEKYRETEISRENSIEKYKKTEISGENNTIKYNNNKIVEEQKMPKKNNRAQHFVVTIILIAFSTTFSLTGCQRLTDVEEKSYILSMYVDYPSDEENAYEFWVARANLSKMEEQSDEIPCQITKIKARNLQELEENYLETVPGKTEWNHIYTIFLGSGMAANKRACTRLLKEWDNEWQKSPNVLLALCPETPKKLYKIKNIPDGAAGQEANFLAEQNKEKYSEQICETPIDYLCAREQKVDKIALYRVTIENGTLKIAKGAI